MVNTLMKAITCARSGSSRVLQLREVEKPVPADDQVLVKVHASSVNFADSFTTRLMSWGAMKRTTPGSDIAGRVEAVGRNVAQLRPGDEVYGDLAHFGMGSLAEYACAHTDAIALKPVNLSFEEAAAVPMAGITALQGLRKHGNIQPGQKVLIHGASGGIGTFAVQIAKSFGADVTGVCSTRNLERVRSIGADHVIDYTKEDFTRSAPRYDLILAVKGYHSIFAYKRALSPTGTYVMAGGAFGQVFQAMLLGPRITEAGGRKLCGFGMTMNQADLVFMKELIEAGKVKPVIDRRYPLSETNEALRYLDTGRACGKVVITGVNS